MLIHLFSGFKKNNCIWSGEILTVINGRGGVLVKSSPRMLDIGGSIPDRDRSES